MTKEETTNQEKLREQASNMDQINHQLLTIGTENQYVTFQIGDEEYGIDIMLVQEITRYEKPTRVYNSSPEVKGVSNFRGRVIPVLDMRAKFNLPAQEFDPFTVVIVVEHRGKTMGMIVDRVSDIVAFSDSEIQAVDQEMAEDMKTSHLKAMGKAGAKIYMLLDPDVLITFVDPQKAGKTGESTKLLPEASGEE